MPTGRAVAYEHHEWEDLKRGVTLSPPKEAHRAYCYAEGGLIRWCQTSDGSPDDLSTTVGFPLMEGVPEEFDTDLQYLHFKAGAQDVRLHVYYYRSA